MAAKEPPWQQTTSGNYQTVCKPFYWMIGLRTHFVRSDRPADLLGGCIYLR